MTTLPTPVYERYLTSLLFNWILDLEDLAQIHRLWLENDHKKSESYKKYQFSSVSMASEHNTSDPLFNPHWR